VVPTLLRPAYVSVARRDITVSPFAMQIAFLPSDYYELIRLPKCLHVASLFTWLHFPLYFPCGSNFGSHKFSKHLFNHATA